MDVGLIEAPTLIGNELSRIGRLIIAGISQTAEVTGMTHAEMIAGVVVIAGTVMSTPGDPEIRVRATLRVRGTRRWHPPFPQPEEKAEPPRLAPARWHRCQKVSTNPHSSELSQLLPSRRPPSTPAPLAARPRPR